MNSPGFGQTHQYGTLLPVVPEEDQFLSCPCGRGDRDSCSLHSNWAGEGFEQPYEEA